MILQQELMETVVAQTSFKIPRGRECPIGLAFDIGGSLIKVAHFKPTDSEDDSVQGTLHLRSYQLPAIGDFTKYLRKTIEDEAKLGIVHDEVVCTGLGYRQHAQRVEADVNIRINHHVDEINCNARGVQFLYDALPEDQAIYQDDTEEHSVYPLTLPYLGVNIGSGVSFVKVDKDGSADMIGASNRAGRSLMGLAGLTLRPKKYDEILDLVEKANHINGKCTSQDGFKEELALFQDVDTNNNEEDTANVLIDLIISDVAHLGSLYASIFNMEKVIVAGSLTDRLIVRQKLRGQFHLYSKKTIVPVFVRNASHVGAIGALFRKGKISTADASLFELQGNKYKQ